MQASGPAARIARNPFYVLGLAVDCSRAEIEREGQKLLGMLALDLSAARTYATPLGTFPRTAEAVREAMAELRDPERRLLHEMWARLGPDPMEPVKPVNGPAGGSEGSAAAAAPGSEPDAQEHRAWSWAEAMTALGWQRRRA